MIKNFVFDMGKILMDYESMRACKAYIEDEADQKEVCTALFVSPEWVQLDMGIISEEQALRQVCSRLPQRLHESARLCLENWDKKCMWQIEEMKPILRRLKQEGFGLYICSNASVRLPAKWKSLLPEAERFDGALFSAEVLCMKPQKEMYQHFFSRFSLKPDECFFIDDLRINIEGARACGMDGYCHDDGDVSHLDAVLKEVEKVNMPVEK